MPIANRIFWLTVTVLVVNIYVIDYLGKLWVRKRSRLSLCHKFERCPPEIIALSRVGSQIAYE